MLLFRTFSANLFIFTKDQVCRLTWIIWSYDDAWMQPNMGWIPTSKYIKSQLKVCIWKVFQLVINTFQCNAKENKGHIYFVLYTALCISSEKKIGRVDAVLLPTLMTAFVKLLYEEVYISQLKNYPCIWDSDLVILS